MNELCSMVEEMISVLRLPSFDELNSLAAYKENHSKEYSFATWKDTFSPNTIRIVVQGHKASLFGSGQMYARGFRKNQSGQIEDLTEDELFEFS
jgi:hypothetical protein